VDKDTKPYLEYLDKEMTIMGVLSAFAVAVPGLVISQVAGAESDSHLATLWKSRQQFFLLGSAALLLSALFFYRQRSLLAWYYGQICLTLSPYGDVGSIRDWLRDADSWATWINYRWAFGFLTLGFFQYGVAIVGQSAPVVANAMSLWTIYIPTVLVILICSVQAIVLQRYRYSDNPWKDLFKKYY
jgi:hypothetical protein